MSEAPQARTPVRTPPPHRFRLYRTERTIFSFQDYGLLMGFAREHKVRSVIEFGPGISTLALLEAGVQRIDTCEYQERFFNEARARFRPYQGVKVHRFANVHPLLALDPPIIGQRYDMGFVDSPVGQGVNTVTIPELEGLSRYHTVCFAFYRGARWVLLHDALRDGERATLERLRNEGYSVSMLGASRKGIAVIERA